MDYNEKELCEKNEDKEALEDVDLRHVPRQHKPDPHAGAVGAKRQAVAGESVVSNRTSKANASYDVRLVIYSGYAVPLMRNGDVRIDRYSMRHPKPNKNHRRVDRSTARCAPTM
jgi:hypothetical protein